MDLSAVRPILEHDGPFLTLHVEVGRSSENPAEQIEGRWTSIRHRLEHEGTDPALLEAFHERVVEPVHLPGEVRRTVVAHAGDVVFDDVQAGHNRWPETLDRGDLPDLAAWLTAADRALPFVLVVADREGADLEVHRALAKGAVERDTVTGETFYITKVAPGDWAQKQFQQTAENTWKQNARLVAEETHTLVRRHRPRAVFVAGEERARHEVLTALEEGHVAEGAEVVGLEAGGRAAGASDDALWEELRERLAELEAERDAGLAARLEEARGRGEGAAVGLDDVVDALAQAQVDTVAVDLDAMRGRTVRPSRHAGLPLPAHAAAADELPADRVLVAAAALSGAQLAVLPEALTHGGGVAALLRWTTPA